MEPKVGARRKQDWRLSSRRQDILIAVVDGFEELAEVIGTAYPKTAVQTCIVHLIRNSLDYAGWKDRKPIKIRSNPL
jgi:putative transposase